MPLTDTLTSGYPNGSGGGGRRGTSAIDGYFWPAVLLVTCLAAVVIFFRLGVWPWDHDEVPSLIELGVADDKIAEKVLSTQVDRLPRLVPLWYTTQRLMLQVLPHDEFGTRVLSALCGLATVSLAFALGWKWRGPLFAAALAMLLALNQSYIWLVQQNRFYSMALLFLTLTLAMIWTHKPRGAAAAALTAVLGLMAVLSHNLVVVVLGIGLIAALIGWILPKVLRFPAIEPLPGRVVIRSGVAAAVALATYLIYLRPIMADWVSGGTGGTNELVSFAAQLGIPTVALALLGVGFGWVRRLLSADLIWWVGVLVGGLMFIGLSPWLLGNWNPRYALFFMPPFWILAAVGVEQVAGSLGSVRTTFVWYGVVALLLLPKLASHYLDGSRHDFRAAARLVAREAEAGNAIYSNWPITLDYYLQSADLPTVGLWPPEKPLPEGPCWVVLASNAYAPVLGLPSRRAEVVAQIAKRRFDEQSHMVRVYRIGPAFQGIREPRAGTRVSAAEKATAD